MTLALNQIAAQVDAMGQHLAAQRETRATMRHTLKEILKAVSTEFDMLDERVQRAEEVQERVRFSWLGAAPAGEALAEYHPAPDPPERMTIIASDGSQIHPDRHGIALYYLLNMGAIVYRQGSNQRPDTRTAGHLYFGDEVLDERGLVVPASLVNVRRDLGELQILDELVQEYRRYPNPIVTLIDGQLTLRIIELSAREQDYYQSQYLRRLDSLQAQKAIPAAYIDRPRSSFVIALMHLATLEPEQITDESLRQNPFAMLTDVEIFDDLEPGGRTAVFKQRAKVNIDYTQAGHQVHFFYLNTGNALRSNLVRVEIPVWIARDKEKLNLLHATLLQQAALTGGYPYVLARAHELAIVSGTEREALETMLSVAMRRHGLDPDPSLKQQNKNLLGRSEPFRL